MPHLNIKNRLVELKWKFFINIFKFLKINNKKIVVDNFSGKGFGDNPKYIIEEILKEHENLDIVWIIRKGADTKLFPKNIRLVKINTIKSIYEYATAKVWIDNIKSNYRSYKRNEQFYLQTWHGGVSLKKVEKSVESNLPKFYVRRSKLDSKLIDAMISNSKWQTNDYKTNFWYDGPVYETGLPRNDLFFNETNTQVVEKVKEYFSIAKEKKVILYAPTFREYKSIQEQQKIQKIDEEAIIKAFQRKFGEEYVIIERFHPNVSSEMVINEDENIKNGNNYPDMQELLATADILITDFSSSIFDFIAKSNKVFLYAPDYDDYLKNERSLNFNVKEDLPFSLALTKEQLEENINSYEENEEKIGVQKLKEKLGMLDDGNASKRTVKIILDKINN